MKRKKLECSLDYVVKCRDSDVIPLFARIKTVKCIRDCDEFFHTTNMKLLRRIITENRQKLMYTNNKMYELHLQLSQVLRPDLWDVLDGMSYNRASNIEISTIKRHDNKLLKLQHKTTVKRAYPQVEEKSNRVIAHYADTVVNLSSFQLDTTTKRVLSRGLNFAITPRKIPTDSIITSIEDCVVKNKIPYHDAECMRQDISSLLRKSTPPKSNISKEEAEALRNLRNNHNILVLPADKGNATVVVDTVEYNHKIRELVSNDQKYQKVNYNPTSRVTSKVLKLLQSSDNLDLLAKLRPYSPTSPKIYGLPKIHKMGWPLRPIVSQIDAPTYKMSKHVAHILQQLTGRTSSYVKNSKHFVQLLAEVKVEPSDLMVSFDVSSLFTNVPVEETIKIIAKLIFDAGLPIVYIDWAKLCLTSGYFKWQGEHYLQIDGVAMGSPIAPVAANIFMEWFESTALSTANNKPRYWWRYVDDVFSIVHKDYLTEFTDHLQTIHNNIKFTVEVEKEGVLPFLDVQVIRKLDGTLGHTVYRKPTHTDRYLHADSHHHPSHLSSVPRTLIGRALSLCDHQHIDAELHHVRGSLENNGYKWRQCTRLINGSERKRPCTAERLPVFLPFVKGITNKIGYLLKRRYSINTIYRPHSQMKQILRLPKDKDPLSGPGVYKIPCDCGKFYIGETRRNVATRMTEHIRSIKNVETSKSALSEHALTDGTNHFIRFDKATVLSRERFYVPRKIREAIEISRHPNFNRDTGWTLPPAWKPLLHVFRSDVKPFATEEDTVGIVCEDPTQPYHTSEDDDAQPTRAPAASLAQSTPPRSSRARRAEARSQRAALIAARSP